MGDGQPRQAGRGQPEHDGRRVAGRGRRINLSVNAGITYVVAGDTPGGPFNFGADACSQSPARIPAALTVAATDSTDVKYSYSNYGGCVDLFAPGYQITSVSLQSLS